MNKIKLIHGELDLPTFFPDGTYGFVRSVDSTDLENVNIPGIVMNTYHLMTKVGMNNIKALDGINSFASFPHPIITDSGGFQIFSLIRENPKYGEIRKNEIIFRPDNGDKVIFSPEKCIQMQIAMGSDIIMCLDYCTHPDDSYEINKLAVDTTINWAKKCKEEYNRLIKMKYKNNDKKPLIFGIIQGGNDKDLRKYCAEELIKIGFDGFGFGGWPLDTKGELVEDILAYTASLMPDNSVKYAMGVGKPEEVVKCVKMGYNLFDCVIPTREARHNRLYVFNDSISLDKDNFYKLIRIIDDKYVKDNSPLSDQCDCLCCKRYSKAFLRHLFKAGDPLAYRLATIHNLRFYTMLMERIRG